MLRVTEKSTGSTISLPIPSGCAWIGYMCSLLGASHPTGRAIQGESFTRLLTQSHPLILSCARNGFLYLTSSGCQVHRPQQLEAPAAND
eukprot:2117556-Rhodomonas_salina.1